MIGKIKNGVWFEKHFLQFNPESFKTTKSTRKIPTWSNAFIKQIMKMVAITLAYEFSDTGYLFLGKIWCFFNMIFFFLSANHQKKFFFLKIWISLHKLLKFITLKRKIIKSCPEINSQCLIIVSQPKTVQVTFSYSYSYHWWSVNSGCCSAWSWPVGCGLKEFSQIN